MEFIKATAGTLVMCLEAQKGVIDSCSTACVYPDYMTTYHNISMKHDLTYLQLCRNTPALFNKAPQPRTNAVEASVSVCYV